MKTFFCGDRSACLTERCVGKMWDNPKAILLVVVSVLYIGAMVLLFWRYRIAMNQMAQKMRECEDAKKAQETQEATAVFQEDDTEES